MAENQRTKLLKGLHTFMEESLAELKTDHCAKAVVDPELYRKEEFWKNIVEASKHISHEATKLSLVFSKPPLPDAATLEPICHGLEMPCLALLTTLPKLNEAQGSILRHRLRSDVLSVFRSLSFLLTELLGLEEKGEGHLRVTGNVWENCEKLETTPQDNKSATLEEMAAKGILIKDAQDELEEAIKNNLKEVDDDDDDDGSTENCEDEKFETNWDSDELEIVKAALGIIKTAHTCGKKAYQVISSNGKTDELQDELDIISTFVSASSESVDNLIASLYQPLVKLDVAAKAKTTTLHSQTILDAIRQSHCYRDADAPWFNFMWEATGHNRKKLESLTGTVEIELCLSEFYR